MFPRREKRGFVCLAVSIKVKGNVKLREDAWLKSNIYDLRLIITMNKVRRIKDMMTNFLTYYSHKFIPRAGKKRNVFFT